MVGGLAEAVISQLPVASGRLIIGIAGPPGAGKTTLAAAVTERLCLCHGSDAAVAVPMDGFHLANAELKRLGRAGRKGAPDTFDATGYAALLVRVRADSGDVVYAPAFDHVMNEPVAGSIPVHPRARFVVTEGNYLLVPDAPWDRVRPLLDLSVYLDAGADLRLPGLLARQASKGLDASAARDWVLGSDEANARLVAATRDRADLLLRR